MTSDCVAALGNSFLKEMIEKRICEKGKEDFFVLYFLSGRLNKRSCTNHTLLIMYNFQLTAQMSFQSLRWQRLSSFRHAAASVWGQRGVEVNAVVVLQM